MKRFLLTLLTIAFIAPTVQAEGIHEAVQKGDLFTVKKLLAANPALIKQRVWLRRRPFHIAVHQHNAVMIKYLLSKGADINATSQTSSGCQQSPLHDLCQVHKKNTLDILNLLIKHKADVNAKNSRGETPLHLAVENASYKVIDALIKHGAKINAKNNHGNTPLYLIFHYTLKTEQRLHLVKQLLKYKADINAINSVKDTPLHISLKYSKHFSSKIAHFFIDNGAQINLQNNAGQTPLHLAISKNAPLEIIDKLIKNNARLNRQDKNGNTPLHLALHSEPTKVIDKVIDKLLDNNANVNIQNKKGETTLHLFLTNHRSKKNCMSLIQRLLKKNANVNIKDNNGDTPLHVAFQVAAYHDAIAMLIAADANLHVKNKRGETALYCACACRSSDSNEMKSISLILKKLGRHTNIDRPTVSGQTPLWVACHRYRLTAAKLLLKHGANPNVTLTQKITQGTPNTDSTPLHSAVKRGSLKFVQLLLAHQANPLIAGNDGYTPLHLAAAVDTHSLSYHKVYGIQYESSPREQTASGKIIAELLNYYDQKNINRKTINGETALELAIRAHNFVGVNILLSKTKNLNAIKPNNNQSVTHWAARHGISNLFPILIARKQTDQFTKKNRDGKTPLELACEGNTKEHATIVRTLLQVKVPHFKKNGGGETIMHIAAWYGNKITIRILAQHDKKLLSTKDNSGSAPIHLAAWNGHVKAIEELMTISNSLKSTNGGGSTALHIAAWKGHKKLVTLLLNAKKGNARRVDPNAKDNDGLTPLHKAAWNGHLKIVKQLIAAGANPHAKDNDGYTALTKANEQGKNKVANYLKSVMKK